MGDGLPSLAPQWLKSANSLNLRPGSHSGAASDESKSWRESGGVPSRLGLGAGADREAALETKPQTPTSRRDRGTFTDRSTGRGYQASTDRRNAFPRTPNRLLSDRELLEQSPPLNTPPLGLRLAPRGNEEAGGFSADPFKPSSGHKDDRRSLTRPTGQRMPAGSQRHGGSPPPRAERDFATLGRQVSPRASSGGIPSPRARPSEQHWVPRVPEATPTASLSAPGEATAASAPAPEAVAKAASTPRMADAILQATASQEAETQRLAAARKEQLALRQSKQLIPVVAASKAKHAAAATTLPTASLLTSLKKPSGLEPLGRGSLPTLIPAARNEEDLGGHRSPPPPNPARLEPLGGNPSSGATHPGAKPARDRDRLSFFSSLRRKTSAGSQENGNFRRQESLVSDTASVRESPKANGAGEASNPARGPSPQHSGGGVTGERMGAMPTMTPEEIIFMRSLGWEDGEDDAEGGLTEEEVAAFKAQHPTAPSCQAAFASKGQHCTPPQRIPVRTNGAGTRAPAPNPRTEPQSFHSELEFSDSDSGL